MFFAGKYDVVVIGGGHAGTEASLAAARSGEKTLLLTHNMDTLGTMSCNPAIGGIGKGHLVKEIDALGGLMARATDKAGIQFRTLNLRKGPAVRATRAQADRSLYKLAVRNALENQTNLDIFQQGVDDLIIENGQVIGVVTQTGIKFSSKATILTVGTFLSGKIHIGETNYLAGRAGDPPSISLSDTLRGLPFNVKRLKTGTPPRLDKRSVNFKLFETQYGDTPEPVFSTMSKREDHPDQLPCFITHTNEKTHEIIKKATDRSPIFTGAIEGIGPRYCPSIEDKIVRFADKASHQIFIEPEGLYSNELYPNGISTSLPFDVQMDFIHSIKGLEKAHITRPGYAIEYDFFDPRDLRSSLESKLIDNLFFAGQINGTTGYEEAAAQGILAGINAARKTKDLDPWCPRRDQAYLGVLVDDLITRGTTEPYRMFTSRAEYRLTLREDNADLRLTEIGRNLGIVEDAQWTFFCRKRNSLKKEQDRLHKIWIQPKDVNEKIKTEIIGRSLQKETRAIDLIGNSDLNYLKVTSIEKVGKAYLDADIKEQVIEQIEIQAKYSGYIDRQVDEVRRIDEAEKMALPQNFNYKKIKGLSKEVSEKLERHKPETIGQAKRIPGVTPAAVSLVLIHLKRSSL
tara:strand:+ start:571 stop:2457 length:1887 start_codon:yes stop_codon:yes gene_type:complete